MLPQIVASFGKEGSDKIDDRNSNNKKGLLVVDAFVHSNILPTLKLLQDTTKFVTELFPGECTQVEIQRLIDVGKNESVAW